MQSFFVHKWKHLFHWPGLIFALPALLIYFSASAGSVWPIWPGFALAVIGYLYVNYMGIRAKSDKDWKRSYFEYTHKDIREALSVAKGEIGTLEKLFIIPKDMSKYADMRFTQGKEVEIAGVLKEICTIARNMIERWQTELEKLTVELPESLTRQFISPVRSIVDGYLAIPSEMLTEDTKSKAIIALSSVRDALKKQYDRMIFEDVVDFDSRVQSLADTVEMSSVIFELDNDRAERAKKRQSQTQ
jgi:hypothetical protein